jgi:hypothetical protein
MSVSISELQKAFKKAMIINFENRHIMSFRDSCMNSYSSGYFDRIIRKAIPLEEIQSFAEEEFNKSK